MNEAAMSINNDYKCKLNETIGNDSDDDNLRSETFEMNNSKNNLTALRQFEFEAKYA